MKMGLCDTKRSLIIKMKRILNTYIERNLIILDSSSISYRGALFPRRPVTLKELPWGSKGGGTLCSVWVGATISACGRKRVLQTSPGSTRLPTYGIEYTVIVWNPVARDLTSAKVTGPQERATALFDEHDSESS